MSDDLNPPLEWRSFPPLMSIEEWEVQQQSEVNPWAGDMDGGVSLPSHSSTTGAIAMQSFNEWCQRRSITPFFQYTADSEGGFLAMITIMDQVHATLEPELRHKQAKARLCHQLIELYGIPVVGNKARAVSYSSASDHSRSPSTSPATAEDKLPWVSALQEYLQAARLPMPKYDWIEHNTRAQQMAGLATGNQAWSCRVTIMLPGQAPWTLGPDNTRAAQKGEAKRLVASIALRALQARREKQKQEVKGGHRAQLHSSGRL